MMAVTMVELLWSLASFLAPGGCAVACRRSALAHSNAEKMSVSCRIRSSSKNPKQRHAAAFQLSLAARPFVRRHAHDDVEPCRQFADARLAHRHKIDAQQFPLQRAAQTSKDAVHPILGVAIDVQLRA